jgi:hypothetical protein
MTINFKTIYDLSKTGMTFVGTGYMVHKVYSGVDYLVTKAQVVKTALTGTTAVAAAKTVTKS